MDYVVGSIANLIAGTVTPNGPKSHNRAVTPVKHQSSPNVTPRSELVCDRSAFLSPSVQKKKAILKKSPKRIFEREDLDITSEHDQDNGLDNSSTTSPKAAKIKKHLRAELEGNSSLPVAQVEKQSKQNSDQVTEGSSPKKKRLEDPNSPAINKPGSKRSNKKLNKKQKTNQEILVDNDPAPNTTSAADDNRSDKVLPSQKSKKKNNKNRKKNKSKVTAAVPLLSNSEAKDMISGTVPEVKKKKLKKDKSNIKQEETIPKVLIENVYPDLDQSDSDSEHASDDEIESETEQEVKEFLNDDVKKEDDSSSEDEGNVPKKTVSKAKNAEKIVPEEEEVKRTLFVGNVPLSNKCKKEIKKIFSPHGAIESVRIRTVPVKDMHTNPKLALIKNEIHPERSTVNVYVKYCEASSVYKALVENNRLMGSNHLRVTRSDVTGALHDPKKTLFVGNIPFGIEDEVLRTTFENCGAIESVRIVRDTKSQIGKGFGYVNFESKDGVELAFTLPEESITIKNRILRLNRCSQNPQNKSRPQKFPPNRPGQWNNNGRAEGFGKPKDQQEGAFRRISHKRKFQENQTQAAPPQKKFKNLDQPAKFKKERKVFVGVTAEKKKHKKKFNKGEKSKKKLSEILTKN